MDPGWGRRGAEALTFLGQSRLAFYVEDLQLFHQALGAHAHGDPAGKPGARPTELRPEFREPTAWRLMGRTRFLGSWAPSQRARRKRTKWPKPSRGRKAPASATEKHFFLMWEEPPSARREEAESSLTRTPGENVLLPKSYRGAPPGLGQNSSSSENPPNGLHGARMRETG